MNVAFPKNVGGGLGKFGVPSTFTADLLKDTVLMTNPEIILPTHHTSFSMFKEPIEKLYEWNDPRIIQFGEGKIIEV